MAVFTLGLTATSALGQQPAFPASPVIKAVRFNDTSTRTIAPESDNWPISWAKNGFLYTSWGDGGGFGGTNGDGRVGAGIARIEGTEGNNKGIDIAVGKNERRKLPLNAKSEGVLAPADTLYLWRNGNASGVGAFRFSQLWCSDDLGKIWRFTRVEFSKMKGHFPKRDEGFFSPVFGRFGRGYGDT